MDDLQRIGKYLLLEKLEETGTGTTFRGAELVSGKIDKYVLLDVLSKQLTKDRAFVDNYLNHSLISTKLEHPNILRKILSQSENGKLYSVFEFNEGFSLQKVLERCQSDGFPLSIDHALLIVSKLLSALAFAKGRHISHGFLVPAMIFVTHEGEIKLRGFSISTALRQYSGNPTDLDPRLHNYAPHGFNFATHERDQLDIFACGSLLYEMLVGEAYEDTGNNDVPSIIANAVTAAEGEEIPEKIAAILRASLCVGKPGGYPDIQRMAKDMEDLLYSGEYSPTTFNLAFFMHSAFRTEMEEMGENMMKEKERDYSIGKLKEVVSSAGAVPKQEIVLPGPDDFDPGGAEAVEAKSSKAKSEGSKSKMPIFLGIGIGVAVALVLGFLFLGKDSEREDLFAAKEAQLQKESEKQSNEALLRQQEDLRIQNQMLMEELQRQSQEKEELRKQQLLNDMKRVEQELKRANNEKAASNKLEEERARITKETAELEANLNKKREADERARKQREQLTQQAERSGNAGTSSAPTSSPANAPVVPTPTSIPGSSTTVAEKSPAPTTAPAPSNVIADKAKNEPAPATAPAVVRPPNPGDLIEFDDPNLVPPILLEAYDVLDVPSKAIKEGAVRRDKNFSIILKVLVNESGRVDDISVFRNPLEGKNDYGMVEKAIKTAKKVKFSTPKKMDVPVKVWWFMTVNFRSK